MKQKEKNKIKAIALQVRLWAEKYAAENYFDSDLCGLCAIASSKLQKALRKENILSEIHVAVDADDFSCHVFVVIKNYIVDITATQFKKGKIVLRQRKEKMEWFWTTKKIFKTSNGLINYQKKECWCPDQIAIK